MSMETCLDQVSVMRYVETVSTTDFGNVMMGTLKIGTDVIITVELSMAILVWEERLLQLIHALNGVEMVEILEF